MTPRDPHDAQSIGDDQLFKPRFQIKIQLYINTTTRNPL